MESIVLPHMTVGPTNLIGAPQTVTGAWVALGAEIDLRGLEFIYLWHNTDINNSLNVRFYLAHLHTTSGVVHLPPNMAWGATDIKINYPLYGELNADADQIGIVPFELHYAVLYGRFYVMAETVGVTPAQILTAAYTANT